MKRKVLIWGLIFTFLSAYSWQILRHSSDSAPATVYAATPQEIAEEKKRTVFQQIIDRLSLRKQEAEELCNTVPGQRGEVHCKKASIFSQIILILSAHVS